MARVIIFLFWQTILQDSVVPYSQRFQVSGLRRAEAATAAQAGVIVLAAGARSLLLARNQ